MHWCVRNICALGDSYAVKLNGRVSLLSKPHSTSMQSFLCISRANASAIQLVAVLDMMLCTPSQRGNRRGVLKHRAASAVLDLSISFRVQQEEPD